MHSGIPLSLTKTSGAAKFYWKGAPRASSVLLMILLSYSFNFFLMRATRSIPTPCPGCHPGVVHTVDYGPFNQSQFCLHGIDFRAFCGVNVVTLLPNFGGPDAFVVQRVLLYWQVQESLDDCARGAAAAGNSTLIMVLPDVPNRAREWAAHHLYLHGCCRLTRLAWMLPEVSCTGCLERRGRHRQLHSHHGAAQ